MAILITNGTYYIRYTVSGATKKTTDINLAHKFSNVHDAIHEMKKAKGQTKNYYVFDTLSQHILWKHMTPEELEEVRRNKLALSMVKRDKRGRVIRKTYSEDTRKLIYKNAHGRCELCGRKILLEDMTLDHINPLSMGGEDDVENLACTCYSCNLFKGNILPDDFMERITEIFMYQMEMKSNNGLRWKLASRLFSSLQQKN